MGDVWRARGTDLERHVAMKAVSDHVAHDVHAMQRFHREARILAGLEHANIVRVYGSEEAEGRRFLAMELVEGRTLADQLADGAVPVTEALEIAVQVSQRARSRARTRVIHRDLKPANILLADRGSVKLIDFGLAKDPRRGEDTVSVHSPTSTAGTAFRGTAGYMSPEAARSEDPDTRGDVWALPPGPARHSVATASRSSCSLSWFGH